MAEKKVEMQIKVPKDFADMIHELAKDEGVAPGMFIVKYTCIALQLILNKEPKPKEA